MRSPKLLPWIARKAGIHEDLALKLWRRAAGEAEKRVGNAQSSEYHAAALDRFLSLVDDEAIIHELPEVHPLGWMWRYQNRMATHTLQSSAAACRWWNNLCTNLSGRTRSTSLHGFF